MRRNKGGEYGFSLIEIMVVLFIIGLIAGLTFPRLGGIEQARLKNTVRTISGTVQLVYNLAILNKVNFRLGFDLNEQSYWVERRDGAEYVAFGEDLTKKRYMDEGIYISEVELLDRKPDEEYKIYIYFSPEGYVELARIYIESESGSGYTIFTEPLTGRVAVYQGKLSFKDYEEIEQ